MSTTENDVQMDVTSESKLEASEDAKHRLTIEHHNHAEPPTTENLDVEQRPIHPNAHGTDLWVEHGFDHAFDRTYVSPYFWANVVYVAYAIIIIDIDMNESVYPLEQINAMYFGANIIHLTNAIMYMWVWYHEGFRGLQLVLLFIPEFLNCCEASLYITSSTMYNSEGNEWPNVTYSVLTNVSVGNSSIIENITSWNYVFVQDPITTNVQNIEMTASVVAFCAAIGWCMTWYMTYRRIPGRGFTFDDPDVWALLTILVGDLLYIIYNSETIDNRQSYGTNYLYVSADWVFVFNSWVYLLCALRDADWFYLLPTGGRPNFDAKYIRVDEIDKYLTKDKEKKKSM